MSEEKTVKGLEALCNAMEKIAQNEGAIKVVTGEGCRYHLPLPNPAMENAKALETLKRGNCDSVEPVQGMADTTELLNAKKYTKGNRMYVTKLKDDTPGKEAALESINDLLSIIDTQMEILERAKKRDGNEMRPHFKTELQARKLIRIKEKLEEQGYIEKISGSDWLDMFDMTNDKYPTPDEKPHPICTQKLSKQQLANMMQAICGKCIVIKPAIRYYFGEGMTAERAHPDRLAKGLAELLTGFI